MKQLLREILRENKKGFLTILFWNIIVSLMGGIGIVMLVPLLNTLEIGSTWMPDWFMAISYPVRVAILLVSYIALVTIKSLISRRTSLRESEFLEDISLKQRRRLYDTVFHADLESLTLQKDTDIINLFTSQCSQVSYAISEFIHLLVNIFSAVIQLTIALMMSVPVTLLVCILGVCMIAVFRPLRKKSREYGDRMIKLSREFYSELNNQLVGVKEIRAYGVQKQHAEQFEEISSSFKEASIDYARRSSVPSVVYSVAAALLIAAVYLVCTLGLRVETDRLVILVYVFARLWPIASGFQSTIQHINRCIPSLQKIVEAEESMRREVPGETIETDFSSWSEAAFENVSFTYRDSDSATLQNVNFTLRRGETLALLGRNGAGKTTAVNLLLGFLLPGSGAIRVDGTALTSATQSSWRAQAGYIPQDPLILNASVRDNLKRFHPDATDEDIIAALKSAMAWDFVSKLENGLDTTLGDRGVRLSGGQRQRIVLARVLLGKPSLVILDEATSALDYDGENAFRRMITSMRSSACVVLIAHSLATVRMADYAVVLEDGTISEQGTIKELLNRQDGYLAGMAGLE